MCVLYGGFFLPIYGRAAKQAAKNHCGISGLWDSVSGWGSAFRFRLAVHGECDPSFDGRQQMVVYRKKTGFLYGIFFFCTRDMGRLITESLYYLSNGKIVQGLDDENMIYRNVVAVYSTFMVLRIILLSVMLLFLSKKLKKGPPELHTKELCYLCLTPVVGIMFGNIIFRLLFTIKENVFFSLYDQYPAFTGLVPLIAALFYAGVVVAVASWQEMVGLQEEKKKYFVEQQQLAAIRERIGEVEQFYDRIRRMKHEMKNHLTNIKGLAGSGSYEEMEQYSPDGREYGRV